MMTVTASQSVEKIADHKRVSEQRGWTDMYHVTPRANRESIMNLGLMGDSGSSPWSDPWKRNQQPTFSSLHTAAPIDELAGFLTQQTGRSTFNPNNPLAQDAAPSANQANPNMNPNLPGSYANPSNQNLNPDVPGSAANTANPEFNPNIPGSQTNPSNPMRNPNLPGSQTNPSNMELNPNVPGSLTNPSNPIHNPDYPAKSTIEPPPGISENASLPPSIYSAWHLGDNATSDSRNFPDPLESRPSKPPTPVGCTCPIGHKLDCPVHGLDPVEPDLDHSWSVPENTPVGYPQSTPRGWQTPYQSSETSTIASVGLPTDQVANQIADSHTDDGAKTKGTPDQQDDSNRDHAQTIARLESSVKHLMETQKTLRASISQEVDHKPRKLVISRDAQGRMTTASMVSDEHEDNPRKLIINRDSVGRMTTIEEV